MANKLSPTEKSALLLLQSHLHHKPLKIKASSSTKERMVEMLKQHPEKNYLLDDLREAISKVAGWVGSNKAALYQITYKVEAKNKQMLSTNFYSADELTNILFLESLRIMYNYKTEGTVKPLTYLLASLNPRKVELIYLSVPSALGNNVAQGACLIDGTKLDYKKVKELRYAS